MDKVKKSWRDYWLNWHFWAFYIIASALSIALVASWSGLLDFDSSDLLHLLLFSVAGIGGSLGLRIAAEKQETLSEQVQVQADQIFNEKLGWGVELLTNEDIVGRTAGVRILVDLANNTNEVQRPIVVGIIYDFFREKAKIKYDENGKRLSIHENDSRQDLQSALDFILDLHGSSDREELNKKLNLFDDDQEILHFDSIDFSRLNLFNNILDKANFFKCYFYETKFDINMMMNVKFSEVEMEDSSFGSMRNHHYWHNNKENVVAYRSQAWIYKSNLNFKSIKRLKFCGAEISKTNFLCNDMVDVSFEKTDFLGGEFCVKNQVKVLTEDSLPHFVGTCLDLKIDEFVGKVKSSDFFESCYYYQKHEKEKGQARTENIPLDASRGVKINDGNPVFVPSDKPWSEQPTLEWIAVEIAKWKLDRAKKTSDDTTELEKELAEAEEKLHRAQSSQKPLFTDVEERTSP